MKIDQVKEVHPFTTPAQEVTNFLMTFALDFEAREDFGRDKESFLQGSGLSDDAQKILEEPNSNALLGLLNSTEVSALIAVIIISTVTTEVVVV